MGSSETFELALLLTLKDQASAGLEKYIQELKKLQTEGKNTLTTLKSIQDAMSKSLRTGKIKSLTPPPLAPPPPPPGWGQPPPNPARLAKTLEYPSRKDFLEDYRRRTAWVRALYDRVVPK